MGLSAGLFETSYRDPRFGHVVTQDLAAYHATGVRHRSIPLTPDLFLSTPA